MAASSSRRAGVVLWATLAAGWCSALHAETLREVVDAYEVLARANDPNEGPGWPDVSAAASKRRLEQYNQLRERLGTLADTQIGDEDRLTRELLDWRLGVLIEGARFDEDRIPFDSDGFFNAANYAAQVTRISNEEAATAWIARLQALPTFYDAQIENMRRGIATRFAQPRSIADGVLSRAAR